MSETSSRNQRVADQIHRELATLIQIEMKDPRIGMVSITGVDISRDLGYANVYVTVLNTLSDSEELNHASLTNPGEIDKLEDEENLKTLRQAAGFLRSM